MGKKLGDSGAAFNSIYFIHSMANEPEPNKVDNSIYLIHSTAPELSEEGYQGFVGEFVKDMGPFTEATDACIIGQLLPAVGMMFGPRCHVWGGCEQPARINVAIVGPTSSGRKGTGLVPTDLLMKETDDDLWDNQRKTGLSSGEGLIASVADIKHRDKDSNQKIEIVEKRVLVVEPEFAKVMAQTKREGNILSPILRESYDSGNLSVMTRDPLHARNAHICIIGHITPEELKKRFSEIEMCNGFGNRFLWFYVKSEKLLPCAKRIPTKIIQGYAKRLRAIILFTSKHNRIVLSKEATIFYKKVYPILREDRPGFIGALTARGESIVLRLSLIDALLDIEKMILVRHLEAAIAIWKYNLDSVAMLFGDRSGNTLADRVYQLLGNSTVLDLSFV